MINSSCSRMRGGSQRVCGGFENDELTYDSSKI